MGTKMDEIDKNSQDSNGTNMQKAFGQDRNIVPDLVSTSTKMEKNGVFGSQDTFTVNQENDFENETHMERNKEDDQFSVAQTSMQQDKFSKQQTQMNKVIDDENQEDKTQFIMSEQNSSTHIQKQEKDEKSSV